MSTLYIEGTAASSDILGTGVALHAYLVYADSEGSEYVLRGGPGGPGGLSPTFGSINVVGGLLENSRDARGNASPADRGALEISLLGEQSADSAYAVMAQLGTQINAQQLTYRPFSTLTTTVQNSNSVIATLLDLIGIPFTQYEPQPNVTALTGYVGSGTVFQFARNVTGTFEADNLFGASGNDVFRGGEGRDRLYGRDGADQLYGDAGNDLLVGGAGADKLVGGAGDDVMNAYDDFASDTMDGEAGADVYYMGKADSAKDTGTDRLEDKYYHSNYWSFTDQDGWYQSFYFWDTNSIPTEPLPGGSLRLASIGDAANQVTAVTTIDAIRAGLLSTGVDETGILQVTYNSEEGGGSIGSFNWADGSFHLDVGREAMSRSGTSAADRMDGSSTIDLLIGGDGNDHIEGKAGNDELSGESGIDSLDGGSGNDVIYGDRGDDNVDGGSGDDRLWGGSDNDRIKGGSGTDMLSGNDGNDKLDGESGDDRLLGGAGTDRLTGSSGNDVFVFHAGDGADVITDYRWFGRGNHHDSIEISAEIAGFDNFAEILAAASQIGTNTVIDFGNGDLLTLENVRVSSLQTNDFAFM